MDVARSFYEWDEKTYSAYYREPAHKNLWFSIATVFFASAVGHGIWILSKYGEILPSAMHWTFVSAIVLTPLPWLRALQQHRRMRRWIEKQPLFDDEVGRKCLREAASGTLFVLWVAYVGLNLLFQVLLHFAFAGRSMSQT